MPLRRLDQWRSNLACSGAGTCDQPGRCDAQLDHADAADSEADGPLASPRACFRRHDHWPRGERWSQRRHPTAQPVLRSRIADVHESSTTTPTCAARRRRASTARLRPRRRLWRDPRTAVESDRDRLSTAGSTSRRSAGSASTGDLGCSPIFGRAASDRRRFPVLSRGPRQSARRRRRS